MLARPASHRVWTEKVGRVPRLPAELLKSKWCRIVAGSWRSPGKIHNKEACASLLGLRRAARSEALFNHQLLSLGDNHPDVLSYDWES